MHVRVALFARHRIRRECTREREPRIIRTRTRVTSCPRSIPLPPTPHSPLFERPPFGIYPRSIRPMALLPPFRLLAPTTPGLFLGGSSIAPNHPHLPSCFYVPLKTPESSPISPPVPFLSPSSLRPYRAIAVSPWFFFIRGFLDSVRVRAIKLSARGPLLSADLPSKLASAISG